MKGRLQTVGAQWAVSGTVLAWLLLLAGGVVMVNSATVAMTGAYTEKHLLYLLVSLVGLVFAVAIPLEWWRKVHQLALVVALLFCAAVLLPGVGTEVNGARRWVRLGAFSLQASEVAKPLVLIYLAGYLERFGHLLGDRSFDLIKPLLLVGLVCFLLILEPDFGGAVVLASATCGILFVAGARLRHFLLLVLVAGALAALLVVAEPYRVARMTAFTDPWAAPFGGGYQLTQALIAFGRGEVFGLGLGESIQKLEYLPEAHNDFIVAVIAEEFGMVGVYLLMALFVVLVLGVLTRARRHLQQERRFAGYLCYGIALVFALQFLVNVGVNTGVLPTKGLTLPFVSFGGNSLIVCCGLFGLVLRGDVEAMQPAQRRRQKNGSEKRWV